jgi:hypothetical protein
LLRYTNPLWLRFRGRNFEFNSIVTAGARLWSTTPRDEIEKGISAVHWGVGGPTAPYFRFPALRQPQELIEYLGKRNIGIFSTDLDSFDFKMRKAEQVTVRDG